MAKRKEQVVDGVAVVVEPSKKTEAEVFAGQRRIEVLTKAEGERLAALLEKAKVQYAKRGNEALTMLSIKPKSVVIDLTR